jgi:hypothetical protein
MKASEWWTEQFEKFKVSHEALKFYCERKEAQKGSLTVGKVILEDVDERRRHGTLASLQRGRSR